MGSVLNPLKSSLKKSVLTNINKRLKIPLPLPLRSHSPKKKMYKWSLYAHQDTLDTVMEDMVDTEDMANTAKRLPKLPNTMFPLSLLSTSPLLLPTPNPSRYASTNPSLFPVLLAKILSAPNVSLSQKLNLLFPSKFALNWYMDMPMNKLLIN